MKLLKKIKPAIFRHFELRYWYRIRKITELWFDDEDAKWKNQIRSGKRSSAI